MLNLLLKMNEILLSPMLGPYLAYVFATEVFVVTCVYIRVIGIRRKVKIFMTKSTNSVLMFRSQIQMQVQSKKRVGS